MARPRDARRPRPGHQRAAGRCGSRARPPSSAPSTMPTPSNSWWPPSCRPSAPTSGSTGPRPALFARFPDAAVAGRRAGRGGRGADPIDGVLPGQGPQPGGHGRAPWSSGSAARCPTAHGGSGHPARASDARRPTWCAASPSACPGLRSTPMCSGCSHRLGLTQETDPVKVETVLNAHGPGRPAGRLQPAADPPRPGHLHGPVAPVHECVLADFCPVGRPGRPSGARTFLSGSWRARCRICRRCRALSTQSCRTRWVRRTAARAREDSSASRGTRDGRSCPGISGSVTGIRRRICDDLVLSEPVPANWFHRAGSGSAARPARAKAPFGVPSPRPARVDARAFSRHG